jgi:DNA processing protein
MTQLRLDPDTARHALSGLRPIEDDAAAVAAYAAGVWSCLVEPGDSAAGALVAQHGAAEALRIALAAAGSRDPDKALQRWAPRMVAADISAAFERAARQGVRLVTPRDPEWPGRLADLGDHAPLCLWVRSGAGETDPVPLGAAAPAVAVVGARAATGYGEAVATELSAALAGLGVTVVSGAAYGIDGAAHRAALLAGGSTTAVLAGGVERSYPAGHAAMLDRIAATGAVVSEVPCGSAPTKWRFLQRNRIIAAIADATVVVEAGWRSGSLNTASHAATLGRPLGVVPGPVTNAASAGCHRLLREGYARCVTSVDEVLELIGLHRESPGRGDDDAARPRTDDLTRVGDALSPRSWRTVDDIARRSGLAVADVEARLGVMLLGGSVDSDGRGWRLAPR